MATKKKRKSPSRYRRFKRHFRRKDKSIPILPVGGSLYTVFLKPHPWAAAGDTPLNKLMNGQYDLFLGDLVSQAASMTPDFKTFDAGIGLQFYAPIVGGLLGHWLANKAGINKYMHRIPMVGKYISL